MPSQEHEAMVAALQAAPVIDAPTVAERRAGYEAMLRALPLPDDLVVEPFSIGHLNADWVSIRGDRTNATILYLHGGGYVIGSNVGYREFAGRLARATGARVCVIDYRLAPEHPFPAAVEDATYAFRYLIEEGIEPGRIVIAGDSAGGGLAVATLLQLREAGDALPACAVVFSPWTDLMGTGATLAPGAVDDPLVRYDALHDMAAMYGGDELGDPLVSPLYGDHHGLPPLEILVGTREVLLDDARRLRDKALAAGVEVRYFEGEGLIHVWPVLAPGAPESARALERVGEFVRAHTV